MRQRCIEAHAKACIATRPITRLNSIGYLTDYREALLEGVTPESFVSDLEAGAGNELQGKFLAPHSSSALAVNSFGWFAGQKGRASLAGHCGLDLVGFEQKFPTGLKRAQPPNLDIVLQRKEDLIAVESKCLEYLNPKPPKFSSRYRTEILDERRNNSWFAEMERIVEGKGSSYRHLDVAQLIKHALGLGYRQERAVTLIYLWWEPANSNEFPVFAAHRKEVERLSDMIGESQPAFRALTYTSVWEEWLASQDERLAGHAANLMRRYIFPV